MKIIVTGGGTGGHIFPAIAIADAIKARMPETEFLFIGAFGKMEMDRVPKAGYAIEGIPVAGLYRNLTLRNIWRNLGLPFRVLASLLRSRSLIKQFKPDVVIGTGGYVSGPVVRVAARLGIPTMIQEQNSYAGMTNRLLAKRAALICVAYPNMDKYFPADKLRFTGNPVRNDLVNLEQKRAEAIAFFKLDPLKKTILILGGSLGARTLNRAMRDNTALIAEQTDLQIIWQCGSLYEAEYRDCATAQLEHVQMVTFVSKMDYAYAAADVVVTRAGALTITELCNAAKPALLIPSPNVAEDHQTKNAMALVDIQAARMVRDIDAAQQMIPAAIEILSSQTLMYELSEKIKTLAKPRAASVIAEEVLRLVKVIK
jgi:UDP-N-acetylglucosamine--N-acetylmuramyl-(pentapeptide) pyrophosphoryl-undecaprenol N-acetylglucosamine transferase